MAGVRRKDRTPRRKSAGAHRKGRTRRTAVATTVAASGAAVCIGAASYFGAPTAEALSVLLPGPPVDGAASATRVNILEGNVFNPQFGLSGNNSSTNLIIGRVALNQCYGFINSLLSIQINLSGTTGRVVSTQVNILSYNVFNPQFSLSGANISNNVRIGNVAMDNGNNAVTSGAGGPLGAGNGNTVQFSFLSGNIFNPQISLSGANISNNVTVTNIAMNNGNNSVATTTGAGGLPFLGGGAGNGNAVQFSLFSGNIFNPQISLSGANISNNVTVTNVAMNNGNFSQAISSMGNSLGSFVFGGGNGNTYQYGFYTSNISNPQWTLGGGNTSNNSATTNTADGNGNGSTNAVTGGGLGSTVTGTGNGNTNQTAGGSGNIHNDQVNIGAGGAGPGGTSTTTSPRDLEDVISLVSASSARTTNSSLASVDRPARTNRQSQQERRESFSLNSFSERLRPSSRAGSKAADNNSQPTGADQSGAATGNTTGTDDGAAADNSGDTNGDSAD